MKKRVRVRFAPSPTGGLHLGGVRTVLYNYLFAKQHGGDFILRIEDTDQGRYVPGAEEYIYQTLAWCGMEPDEGPKTGGPFAPYRQSERKAMYRVYAEQLVNEGHAYYAFDTTRELEAARTQYRTEENPSPQYDQVLRTKMRNALTLTAEEVSDLLQQNAPYVIRIKMPEGETISFTDMIRGEVSFDTSVVDDKVLLKSDGMPTYHLAVVVDDHLMQITHAFRGEEWLPSAPVHVLVWRHLFGEAAMPHWAHLPLILGPNGKLSKRDGAEYGFPVFAMNWTAPTTGELTEGFRERGFLPTAFVNLLAMLGWNDGTEQEIFTEAELVQKFDIEKVHKGGAKFDYEKALWYNHEWIKRTDPNLLLNDVMKIFGSKNIAVTDNEQCLKIIALVKDRCHLLTDFIAQGSFFFVRPADYDVDLVKLKWNDTKAFFFTSFIAELESLEEWNSAFIEHAFKNLAASCNIKPGELQLPLRIMLVGGKYGPPVFDIAELLGTKETTARIASAVSNFNA
ncbi:MAG: glutamate--tRNA ligase [Chitinophagaceae bacterium]